MSRHHEAHVHWKHLVIYASSLSQVGFIEGEPSGDKVSHDNEVASRTVTAGLGFCGLNEAVDSFEDAVCGLGSKPAKDTVPVAADGLCRFDPGGAPGAGRPPRTARRGRACGGAGGA